MIGSDVAALKPASGAAPGEPLLELAGLSMPTDDPFGVALKSIDLVVRSGEIVAVAGVAGNGPVGALRRHLGRADERVRGCGQAGGAPCGRENISRRRRRDAAFVPEERIGHAAVSDMALSENVVLTHHAVGEGVVRNGLINRGAARDVMTRVAEQYDVRRTCPIQRRARFPAATYRSSLSAASWSASPASWWCISRPGGSMRVRRRSFASP